MPVVHHRCIKEVPQFNLSWSLSIPCSELVICLRLRLGIVLFLFSLVWVHFSAIDHYGDHLLEYLYWSIHHGALIGIVYCALSHSHTDVHKEQCISGDDKS